jgi:hypothetical protein
MVVMVVVDILAMPVGNILSKQQDVACQASIHNIIAHSCNKGQGCDQTASITAVQQDVFSLALLLLLLLLLLLCLRMFVSLQVTPSRLVRQCLCCSHQAAPRGCC